MAIKIWRLSGRDEVYVGEEGEAGSSTTVRRPWFGCGSIESWERKIKGEVDRQMEKNKMLDRVDTYIKESK